jgi:hypothetical protein
VPWREMIKEQNGSRLLLASLFVHCINQIVTNGVGMTGIEYCVAPLLHSL